MYINDKDVFDSMRALVKDGVDLDDREAVEQALINPYRDDPETSARFVAWCIEAAKDNSGLQRTPDGILEGFVPPETS